MMRQLFAGALVAVAFSACAGSQPHPNHGGDTVVCPEGTVNAGNTIRTVNCSTVVQYDGQKTQASVDVPGLVKAGLKHADTVLRQVSDAATDSQIQFSHTCESYNACNLTGAQYQQRLDEAQLHFQKIREEVDLLQASKGNPAVLRTTVNKLYQTAVPAQVRAQSALSMSFVVEAKKGSGGAATVLHSGEHLRTGDQVVFGIRVSQAAYVYVFQRKQDGHIDVLFPNPKLLQLSNPLNAGTLVRIPPSGQVFTLDNQDMGREDVFLAVSRTPLSDLQSALGGMADNPQQPSKGVSNAVTNLFAEGNPECANQTRGLQVSKQGDCGTPTRGLTPTKADKDSGFFKGESSVQAQTLPGDDVILRTFSFYHES